MSFNKTRKRMKYILRDSYDSVPKQRRRFKYVIILQNTSWRINNKDIKKRKEFSKQ